MRKEELSKLVLRSLSDEISDPEREVLESEALADYSFSSDFRERVLASVEGKTMFSFLSQSYLRSFDKVFSRVLLTGTIAIIALVISMFITQGSLSFDTLIGIDSSVDDGLLSLLIE